MLLLDLGNTRLKWRLKDGPIQAVVAGDYAPLLAAIEPGVQARMASTARPGVRDELLRQLAVHSIVPRQVVARPEYRGLRLAYADSASFGVDRWVAMVAARERCPGRAVIVLSAGTALTADAVAATGLHLGGYIAPGPAAAAAALPEVLRQYAGVSDVEPGRSTAACVAAGYSSLYIGALALWCQRFSSLDAELFLTGGDSRYLAQWCAAVGWSGAEHPGLVLEGLELIDGGSG